MVRDAVPRLDGAISARDWGGTFKVLEEMGVLALCPPHQQMLDRLEACVGRVIGKFRLIALIELAVFAVELEACDRANKYVAESQRLDPGPSEWHDLHSIAGSIALSSGDVAEATKCLAESIRVCREDEFACLTCSTRALNLLLAKKLLAHGEHEVVANYFVQCQGVWKHFASQIALWIQAIREGKEPEFSASSFLEAMNSPAIKLAGLVVRSSFVGQRQKSIVTKMGRGEISLEDLRTEYNRLVNAAIRGELDAGKN